MDPSHSNASARLNSTAPPSKSVKTRAATTGPSRKWITHPAVICVLLVALAFAVFAPVGRFEFLNYDDHEYVSENRQVQSGLTRESVVWAFTTGHASNWHPITWLSHMLDYQLFGSKAGAHHLINLLFHALNTVLLFLLLRMLTKALWRSAFVAALFALHPLHVESVAWISERKDLLSTCFGLLSLMCYARYAHQRASLNTRPLAFLLDGYYWLALLFFALGLMSKPMLVTLPSVMLLLDYWPLNRFQDSTVQRFSFVRLWPLLIEKLPFFALSAASSVVTFLVQQQGGAVQSLAGISFPARLENGIVSYARYLGKTFWPVNLALPYPHPGGWPWFVVLVAIVLMAGISIAAVWWGRRRPYLFVGWFWFVGMLVPVIGLVQVGGQSMADRYTYVPLVGIFVVLVWVVMDWAARTEATIRLAVGVGVLIVAACAVRSADQVRHWQNSGTLSRHAIAVTRNNDTAFSNLGNYLLDEGRLDEAIEAYHRALQTSGNFTPEEFVAALADSGNDTETARLNQEVIARADPGKLANCGEVLNNLGTAFARKGQGDQALLHYRAVLRIKPNHARALHNMAHELAARGKLNEAVELYRAALRAQPNEPKTWAAMAAVYLQLGRFDDASAAFNEALRVAPEDAETHYQYGMALEAHGNIEEAIRHYQAALRADSMLLEAHNNLGSALMKRGDIEGGVQQFRLLLEKSPEHRAAHENLGVALATLGQFDGATHHLREASRLDPGSANPHFNLGNVLALQGRLEEAVVEYREAIRLNPEHAQAHCHLGGALAELGRRDEAIAQLKEALRLVPDYPQALVQLKVLGAD